MAHTTGPLPEVTTGAIITVGGFGGTRTSKLLEVTIGDITFLGLGADKRVYAPCGMCDDASGYRSAYRHVQSGLCWHCAGAGIHHVFADTLEDAQKKARRIMTRRATEARKAAEKAAKVSEEKAQYRAENAENINRLTSFLAVRNLLEPTIAINAKMFETTPEADAEYRTAEREYYTELHAYTDRRDASADSWLISTLNDILAHVDYADAKERPSAGRWAAAEKFMQQYAEKEAAAQAKQDGSRYAGEEGEKITVTGTVKVVMTLDGDYGMSRMIILENAEQGVTIKWVGTAKAIWDLEQGAEVTLTGTVKKQDEYKGVKQTVLTRCKVQ